MTIKKPMKAPKTAATVSAAAGNAAIADRFKLDMTDSAVQKPATGKATLIAVIAGFISLVVSGLLTYILWQHWEFLMPA